ncbi:hypothetical protein BJX68DRAFT_50962 [Aspergillus pseudodeflectus]|uniref:Uncharacterized protein n=1 Tax=Aspergillus pseudodeflectus TaxID=176178 RepID=A0ABR4KLE4_9EURO
MSPQTLPPRLQSFVARCWVCRLRCAISCSAWDFLVQERSRGYAILRLGQMGMEVRLVGVPVQSRLVGIASSARYCLPLKCEWDLSSVHLASYRSLHPLLARRK